VFFQGQRRMLDHGAVGEPLRSFSFGVRPFGIDAQRTGSYPPYDSMADKILFVRGGFACR
jgi:hypothetical protein